MSKRELKALLAHRHSHCRMGKLANCNRRTQSSTMDSSESTEELRQRVENLERCLLEAKAQVESKVAELQEVWHECDELQDAVAGAEQKLCEKEDELDIRLELDDVLSSDKVY